MSCDSLMPFNCGEFAVEYLRRLSFRILSTAATSLADVPVPLNRRIGGTLVDAGGAQAVMASEMRKKSWAIALIAMGSVNQRRGGTSRGRGLAGKSVFGAFASTVVVEFLSVYFTFVLGVRIATKTRLPEMQRMVR